MKKSGILQALAALSQESRLDAFRLLVRAGPQGVAAGEIAAELGLLPNALTFHLDRLREAGLVTVRRDGRSMIYAAQLRQGFFADFVRLSFGDEFRDGQRGRKRQSVNQTCPFDAGQCFDARQQLLIKRTPLVFLGKQRDGQWK